MTGVFQTLNSRLSPPPQDFDNIYLQNTLVFAVVYKETTGKIWLWLILPVHAEDTYEETFLLKLIIIFYWWNVKNK